MHENKMIILKIRLCNIIQNLEKNYFLTIDRENG